MSRKSENEQSERRAPTPRNDRGLPSAPTTWRFTDWAMI